MVTLQAAARSLADAIGGFGLVTVTEAPSPSDPDARRTIISADLVDEDRDPTSFNDMVVYAADGPLAGQQAAVRRDVYDGTAGRLVTSGQFRAAPSVGQVFELHARLPRIRHVGEPGLREILNEAIDRLWFEDQLVGTPTASTRIAAPVWLTSDRQIVAVLEGGSSGVNPASAGRTATLVHDSTGSWLQLSSVPSGPYRVVCRRPHRSWIKAGGSWATSTAGLVDDDDETMADERALLVVATWRAYRALNRRSPDFELGPWKVEEARAEQAAAAFLQWGVSTAAPLAAAGAAGPAVWAKGGSPGNGWS